MRFLTTDLLERLLDMDSDELQEWEGDQELREEIDNENRKLWEVGNGE